MRLLIPRFAGLKLLHLNAISVSARLSLLVFISVAALLAVGLGGWVGLTQVADSAARLQNERLPAAKLLGDIRSSTSSILQLSFEVLTREKQVNAQSRFQQTHTRLTLASTALETAIAGFEALPKSSAEAEAWKTFKESMKPWMDRSRELSAIIKQMSENDDPDKQSQLFGQYKVPLSSWGHVQGSVDVNLAKLLKFNQEEADAAKVRNEATRVFATRFIYISSGVAALVLIALAFLFVRSITIPLERLRHTIVTIADSNDFTARADGNGKDELSQTAKAFNNLLEKVQNSLRQVLENAENIASSAQEVTAASEHSATSSEEQSEAAASMAAAIEEMTVAINHINENMRDAMQSVHEAGKSADNGVQAMRQSSAEMDSIVANVADTSTAIDRLSGQSGSISLILQVIKEVADQTNLLALNAAIEAARAGEQGRGFAVVADEVRKLAERTTQSTTQIAELIVSMQSSGHDAVSRMASVSNRVNIGKEMSYAAVERMDEIRGNAQKVVTAINDISSSLNEQSSTAQTIAQQVEAVATHSESNNQTAHDTARVAHDLDAYAASLRNAVKQFRV